MEDDQQVVILDKDGVQHVFPSGFDPKRAASIVSGGAADALTGALAAPIGPDGQPNKMNLPHPPKGMLAPIAGMATALVPEVGLPARALMAFLGGSAAQGVDQKLHGEDLSPTEMGAAGLIQGATAGAPEAAAAIGRGAKTLGQAASAYTPGLVGKAAIGTAATEAGRAVGLPWTLAVPAGAAAAKYGPEVAGKGLQAAGDAMVGASTAKTAGDALPYVVPGAANATVAGSRVPMLPDALRKLQLLFAALTGNKDQ